MDIARPSQAAAKKRRRIILGAAGLATVLLITLGLSRLKPAAPSVERATVWIDTVKKGEMLRQVRGLGTLVPEEIRWIPAVSEGRVERIVIQPGSTVRPDSVILELSNPELAVAAQNAEAEARVARAQLTELRVRLEGQRLDQRATLARVESAANQAQLKVDALETLAREGLAPAMDLKIARQSAGETAEQLAIERERLASAGESVAAQLDAKRIEVEQKEAFASLKRSQARALFVPAGIRGVLQQISVEVGQRVAPGTNLARVAQPERLKAVVRIPETQARDVQIGQKASIDTRNEVVEARVTRVDPAVREGSVEVDLGLVGDLPRGARPDLSVDATIELERLANILFVGRPPSAQSEGVISLFRLDGASGLARRRSVRLGRASVSTIEVLGGLAEGDQVILSDTSAWDRHDRIELR
jgi:HlyD family secretion protein